MRLLRQAGFWIIVATATILAVGFLAAPARDSAWPGLFLRLLYLPVIFAGQRYGLKGGLPAGAAAGLLAALGALAGRPVSGWVELPLFIAVGAVSGLLADRQRRADRARRKAERRKLLAGIGDGVAREVRKPLAVIRRTARTLAGNADSRTVELAGTVASEAQRAEQMVSALLRYARPVPLQFGRARLSELFEDCIERFRPEVASRRIEFSRRWPDPEPEIYVDSDQLSRALLNLLRNALDASPDGGRIIIRVEPAGRWVRVTVRDFGPGVPADKLGRVFEPFFTTRERGVGLGLASARRTVAAHDGRLRLENAQPRGVVATLELPGSIGPKPNDRGRAQTEAVPNGKTPCADARPRSNEKPTGSSDRRTRSTNEHDEKRRNTQGNRGRAGAN